MKWKVLATATVISAVMVSCGNNSSDKETTTAGDTSTTTTVTDPVAVNTTSITVPENTRTVFSTKYPTASNVQWSYYRPYSDIEWDWTGWPMLDTADYSARFNWDGTDYWAWYDDQGNWVGTVNVVSDHKTLPAPVSNLVTTQYKDYMVTSINKENDKNRTAYEITLDKNGEKGKILVDENGKVLKKKMTMGDSKMKEKNNPKDSM